ncbi:MAG: hypothetical protein WC598_00650 [Methanoregula sp.]
MESFDETLSGTESRITCYCSCPGYTETPHTTPATAVMVNVNHNLGV